MLKEKDKVSSFTLPDQDNQLISLSDYKGRWVLIYFYPRDNTPGCSLEAQSMNEHLKQFNNFECDVLGVSADSAKSHKKFADKFNLKFQLLADQEKKVCEQFGVWGKKKFMGKEFMGINRTTFLIDAKGRVAKVYTKVKVKNHTQEVLEDLKNIIMVE